MIFERINKKLISKHLLCTFFFLINQFVVTYRDTNFTFNNNIKKKHFLEMQHLHNLIGGQYIRDQIFGMLLFFTEAKNL